MFDKKAIEKVFDLEKKYGITIGKITFPAKISEELKVLGWIVPGGKVVKNKSNLTTIANKLNKLIYSG